MDEAGKTKTGEIHTRLVGWYLMLCAFYQVCISCCSYFPEFFPPPSTVFARIFDYRYRHSTWFEFGNPRRLLFPDSWSDAVYWGSFVWLIAIAIAITAKPRQRSILRAYVFVELTLAALEVAYLLASMVFRHMFPGYAVGDDIELLATTAVILLFSVLPCLYGLWILRKTRPTFLKFGKTENRELRTEN